VLVQVVEAEEIGTGKTVALKVIFLDNPQLEACHADVLRQEFTLMRRLSHPNIVSIDCAIEDLVRKQVVIAEEVCLGGTLLDELQGVDTNDDRMLSIIFKQLSQALAHMHQRNILHRDIKPENIIFRFEHADWNERGAIPVVIDFGMATEYREGQPQTGILGSAGVYARARAVLATALRDHGHVCAPQQSSTVVRYCREHVTADCSAVLILVLRLIVKRA
jgi:serine/threonine protein kinase